jgi:predicted amino acid racemase
MLTLWIDEKKLIHNANAVRTLAEQRGIVSVWPVLKVFAGNGRAAALFAKLGFEVIADSRLDNLKRFRAVAAKKALLRIASVNEAASVVRYADISLQSETATIAALDRAAARQGKIHDVILMLDLGDLREGVWARPFDMAVVEDIQRRPHIRLKGIGTNLTCFGGIVPDLENMNLLASIARSIEQRFNLRLDIVSGGNSSIFPFLDEHALPAPINSIRVGEAIVLGRETAYGTRLEGLFDDVFVLEGDVVECKDKPTKPIGTSTMNSFGEAVAYADRGVVRRAILDIGKQDVAFEYLRPLDPDVAVLGASSDHLIVELKTDRIRLGSKVAFSLTYPGLLQACTSRYVRKRWR